MTVIAEKKDFENEAGSERADDVRDGPYGSVQFWALLATLAGTLLSNVDAAIANIAIPQIAHELVSAPSTAVWVVNTYQLAMAVAVLPLAAIGERRGYKQVYLGGVLVFTVGSVLCALATSIGALIAARALQGLGGACIATLAPALLRSILPQTKIGRGIALLGLTVALSASIGPSLAAAILHLANWRWLFGVNVPIGICVLVAASVVLPEGKGDYRTFDHWGALLSGITLALLIVGVDRLGTLASGLKNVWGASAELGACLLCAAVLFVHQRRHPSPLVPIDLLRIPQFSLSMLTSICSYAAQALALVSLPFLLEHQFGHTTAATGLLITPWPLVIVFIAPLAGRLSDRYPAGFLCALGLAAMATGIALIAALSTNASDAQIIWRVALAGVGFGLYQTPNNRVLLTSGPRSRSGAASGMMTMARMIGLTLGAATAALLFRTGIDHGTHLALITAAAVSTLGAAVSLVRLL